MKLACPATYPIAAGRAVQCERTHTTGRLPHTRHEWSGRYRNGARILITWRADVDPATLIRVLDKGRIAVA